MRVLIFVLDNPARVGIISLKNVPDVFDEVFSIVGNYFFRLYAFDEDADNLQ